jgi:hypothetical protein
MGGTVYKRCEECGRWMHRDETVLRQPANVQRRSHKKYYDNKSLNPTPGSQYPVPRRICLFCVDGYDKAQSQEFTRLAANESRR